MRNPAFHSRKFQMESLKVVGLLVTPSHNTGNHQGGCELRTIVRILSLGGDINKFHLPRPPKIPITNIGCHQSSAWGANELIRFPNKAEARGCTQERGWP